MSNDLNLETLPTGTSGWISVTQNNFDLLENFVNSLHTRTIVHNGDVITHEGEVVVNFI